MQTESVGRPEAAGEALKLARARYYSAPLDYRLDTRVWRPITPLDTIESRPRPQGRR